MLTTLRKIVNSVPSWDPHKAKAAVKGKELLLGRKKKSVETNQLELEKERERLAHAQNSLGEAINAGEDPTLARQAMSEAEGRVKDVLSALSVAQHQQETAERELKNAHLLAEVEQEEAAIAHLKFNICPRFDSLCVELERLLVNELVPGMETARVAVGVGAHASWVLDVSLAIEMVLLRAARAAVPKGRAYVTLLSGRTLVTTCPDPDTVRARRKINEGRVN